MNKSLIAIWALSLGLTFYAGLKFNTSQTVTESSSTKNDKSATDKAKTGLNSSSNGAEGSEPRRLSGKSVKSKVPVNIVLADVKALLGGAGMMGMDMAALAESYNLIKNLDEDDLNEALNQLQGNINHQSNMMPLMLILGRYAELNPTNAMAFYENKITSPQAKMLALNGIVSSWAKNDPDAAYDWYKNTDNDNSSGGIMGGKTISLVYIFQGLAKKDLDGTIEKLKNLGGDQFKMQMAASGIASSLKEKSDFVEFMEKTSDVENSNIRSSVIQNWVMRSPEEAVDWLDNLEDKKQKKDISEKVLNSWMMTNPEKASEWYIAQIDEKDKQKSVEKIVRTWGMTNPQAGIEWLDKQEGINKDKAYKKALSSAVFSNPVYVADNIDKLNKEEDKKEISVQVYQQLKSVNKEKAQEFFEKSSFQEDLKKAPAKSSFNFFP